MRPQFPGMDPWLEQFDLWLDVHNSLIVSIRDALAHQVAPHYFVGVESRNTVLSGADADSVYERAVTVRARSSRQFASEGQGVSVQDRTEVLPVEVVVPLHDDEIEETFLAIKELSGRKIVTVIEVLSPTNKKTQSARAEYLKRRRALIRSGVNFIEIDLLRGGRSMPLIAPPPQSDYQILICRARPRREAVLYAFPWTIPIPSIPIPLLPRDYEPVLDLNSVLHSLIVRAGYDLRINYQQPPEPPLHPEDESWAATYLARATDGILEEPDGGETSS